MSGSGLLARRVAAIVSAAVLSASGWGMWFSPSSSGTSVRDDVATSSSRAEMDEIMRFAPDEGGRDLTSSDLATRAGNYGLGIARREALEGGRFLFGDDFRITGDMRWDFEEGFSGDVDAVVPLWKGGGSAFFLQPGAILWRGDKGTRRTDVSGGLGWRTLLGSRDSAAAGASVFYDRSVERGHQRLGVSADLQTQFATFTANGYYRLGSKWVDGSGDDIEERAMHGGDAVIRFGPIERFNLEGTGSVWKHTSGLLYGGKAELGYEVFRGMSLVGGYEVIDSAIGENHATVGIEMRWPPSSRLNANGGRDPDLFMPVKREKRIRYEERVVLREGEIRDASSSAIRVDEGEDAEVRVRLSSAVNRDVNVKWRTEGDTAEAGFDYGDSSDFFNPSEGQSSSRELEGELTISRGETSGTITIPIADDDGKEGNEEFKVILSSASGASLPEDDDDREYTVRINSNDSDRILDDRYEVSFKSVRIEVDEDESAELTLTRPEAYKDEELTVKLAYCVEDDSEEACEDGFEGSVASSGDDYESASEVEFDEGEIEATVSIKIESDDDVEGIESFRVRIEDDEDVYKPGEASSALVVISASEGASGFPIVTATLSSRELEAVEGTNPYNIEVRLSAAPERARQLTVVLTVEDGTARCNTSTTSSRSDFAPLSSATSTQKADCRSSSKRKMEYPLNFSANDSVTATSSPTLKTVQLDIREDDRAEAAEMFTVELSLNPAEKKRENRRVVLGEIPKATVTILASSGGDEPVIEIDSESTSVEVREGETLDVSLTRPNNPAALTEIAVGARLTSSDGEATIGEDVCFANVDGDGCVSDSSDHDVQFESGSTTATATLWFPVDSSVESAETFTFEIRDVSGRDYDTVGVTSLEITIRDAGRDSLSLRSVGSGSFSEGTTREFEVSRPMDGSLNSAVTATVALGGGDASSGDDYCFVESADKTATTDCLEGTTRDVEIARLELSSSFYVLAVDDDESEEDERFGLKLEMSDAYEIDSATRYVLATIGASDPKVSFSLSPSTRDENGDFRIRVERDLTTSSRLRVRVSLGSDDDESTTDATFDDDYYFRGCRGSRSKISGRTATATIDAGESRSSSDLCVFAVNDEDVEGDEVFEISLESYDASQDSDGGDFEPFVLNDSPSSNRHVSATATIRANDLARVYLDRSSYSVNEGEDLEVHVRLGKAVDDAPVTVKVSTLERSGGATEGDDYVSSEGEFTFAAGESGESGQKTLTIPISDDDLEESTETFYVVLEMVDDGGGKAGIYSSSSSSSLISSGRRQVSVSIRPSDVEVWLHDLSSVKEGDDAIVVLERRSGVNRSALEVEIEVSDGTATFGTDYSYDGSSGVSGMKRTVTIPRNSSTATTTISVPRNSDSSDGARETFTVELNVDPTEGDEDDYKVREGRGSTEVEILSVSEVSFKDSTREVAYDSSGSSVELEVEFDKRLDERVDVKWTTKRGTARPSRDYRLVSGDSRSSSAERSGVLTFFSGDSDLMKSFSLAIPVDSSRSSDREFTIELSFDDDADGRAILSGGTQSATVTIKANE